MVGNAYRHVGFLLLAVPLLMVAGFWIPYIGAFPTFDPRITVAVHVHAALLFTWVALLVVQPLAIRYGAHRLHRRLGAASLGLVPLIALFAAIMLWKEYRESLGEGASPLAAALGEYLSTAQLGLFIGFFVLAIARIRKRDIAAHMRYMICIALVLLPAGLSRSLGYWHGMPQTLSQTVSLSVIDGCLLALIVYDERRRLPSKPYRVALIAYLVIEGAWLALGSPV